MKAVLEKVKLLLDGVTLWILLLHNNNSFWNIKKLLSEETKTIRRSFVFLSCLLHSTSKEFQRRDAAMSISEAARGEAGPLTIGLKNDVDKERRDDTELKSVGRWGMRNNREKGKRLRERRFRRSLLTNVKPSIIGSSLESSNVTRSYPSKRPSGVCAVEKSSSALLISARKPKSSL